MRAVLVGWKPGLNKISLTHYLRAHTNWGLAEAKMATDTLLDGKQVVVEFRSTDFINVRIDLLELGVDRVTLES